ncbi:MAG: efflux RND transporter periplasmic adaptor subunit [bacterium]|nr:efflux RND transporter periplasmic adaptor subunit [bacterium]
MNDILKRLVSKWKLIAVVAVAFILGLWLGGGESDRATTQHEGMQQETHQHESGETPAEKEEHTWTCSMHPQIQQPKQGKCPVCFMDLVLVEKGDGPPVGPRQLKLSPHAIKLAEIQTTKVEKRRVNAVIRMAGKVEYDETRFGNITARVPGRIDKLYVDYTGTEVNKDQQLVSLYSPKLVSAQQELLQAIKSNLPDYQKAAREKLKLWGLTNNQINDIEKRKKVLDNLTFHSPMKGVVIAKNAVEGVYVKTGANIYTIADLSVVWVKLDAYESDIARLHKGGEAVFEVESYPGELFKGKIAFIDPVLSTRTRTVKVRLNVPNPGFKLKPGMFVRAVVNAPIKGSAKTVSGDSPPADEAPLIIPVSAPLVTGKRAVVYVAVDGQEGLFEGREVVLGPRAGNFFIVKKGLEEGESVVVNGAFKIDSDLQIQAKAGMMSYDPEPEQTGAAALEKTITPVAFRDSVDLVADAYFKVQHALSSDSLQEANKAAKQLLEKLGAADMSLLADASHKAYMKQHGNMKTAGEKISTASDMDTARIQFELLSKAATLIIKDFGGTKTTVYQFHCPMAFDDKGAFWLQNHDATRNPYYGDEMLMCKDTVETLVKKQ